MLTDILIFVTSILVLICGVYCYRQFKIDYANDCERLVSESMAARSNKVLLDLAYAYHLPDELGMEKVAKVEKCKAAVLLYEIDYFSALEEMEEASVKEGAISFLRARS